MRAVLMEARTIASRRTLATMSHAFCPRFLPLPARDRRRFASRLLANTAKIPQEERSHDQPAPPRPHSPSARRRDGAARERGAVHGGARLPVALRRGDEL